MKMLLVTEEERDARQIEQALRRWRRPDHIELERASSVVEAKEFLRANTCDFLLLDRELKDPSGEASVAAMRAAAPDTAIVMLTDDASEPAVGEAGEVAAEEYVVKRAVNSPELERAFRHSLERLELAHQLRRSQNIFQGALDAIGAHACVIDGHARIVASNRTWREAANGQPGAGGELCSYLSFCDPETGVCPRDIPGLSRALDELLAGDRKRHSVEYTVGEGEDAKWIRLSLTRFADTGPAHVLATHEDITDRKWTERKALQDQRLRGIGSLARDVAHELSNLLAPMMMSTDLLRGDGLPEEMNDTVDTIEQSARRGAKIVKELLTFGQGVAGHSENLRPETLLAELCMEAHELLPDNVELISQIDPAAPTLRGDPNQLRQVLRELLKNAGEAMPRGGPVVLHCDAVDINCADSAHSLSARPGRYCRIQVKDSGCGIDPDRLDHVFEPFYTTKPVGEATGLGLSTAMGIVRSHEGFIDVRGRSGPGTVFAVHLPVTENAVGEETGPEEPERDSNSEVEPTERLARSQPDLSGFKILVVDDDQAVRLLLKKTLTWAGAEVLTAENGKVGLEIVREHIDALSLIISDFDMPVMDGYEFILQLRSMGCDSRVLISTGREHHAQEGVIRSELGVHDFLLKPYETTTLLEAVANEAAPAGSRA